MSLNIDLKKVPLPMSFLSFTVKPISLEKEWNRYIPDAQCRCTIINDPKNTVIKINLSFNENIKSKQKPKLFSQIAQRVIRLQDSFKKELTDNIELKEFSNPLTKIIFEPPSKELFLFILKHLFGKYITFAPKEHTLFKDLWLIERGSSKSARVLQNSYENFKSQGMSADRLQEISSLATSLENIKHRGIVLMTTSQILLRKKEDQTEVTDLDGVAICINSKELSILLVEAKNTRSRAMSASKRDLKFALEAIGLKSENHPIITLSNGSAYTQIRI